MMKNKKKKKRLLGKIIVRSLACLGTAVALFVILVFGLVSVISLGPSETAKGLFVNSVMGTSAVKFLARIYFSEDEIAKMISSEEEEAAVKFDVAALDLVQISEKVKAEETAEEQKAAAENPESPAFDPAKIMTDADGDGIESVKVQENSFNGNLLIIYDPSRVHFYSIKNFATDGYGKRITDIISETGAVAAINGGGFYDPEGHGHGGMPLGPVIQNGKLVSNFGSDRTTLIGMTGDHKLLAGNISPQEAINSGMVEGFTFGPMLVSAGQPVQFKDTRGGLNPRSAVGQRADGAILLLTINGRQPGSLGATFNELAEVMAKYGAVTAANLDGGSSSRLFLNGEQINNASSLLGMRPVPNAIIVQ